MAAPKFPFTGISAGNEIGNLAKLADYLVEVEGFTAQAAAGVASVVAGESAGNPEARQAGGGGGVGLIQWTPGSTMSKYGAHQPTGNATADFNNQLPALVRYGKSRGGRSTLAKTTSATQAAAIFSRMEAPARPGSDIRAALIPKILAAMGNPPSGGSAGGGSPALGGGGSGGPPTGTAIFEPFGPELSWLGGVMHLGGIPSTIGDVAQGIGAFANDIGQVMKWLTWLFNPAHFLRIGAFIFGAVIIIVAFYWLQKAAGGPRISDAAQNMPPIIPV